MYIPHEIFTPTFGMELKLELVLVFDTARKVCTYGVISDPHFPVFGLNTEIYGVHSVFGHFSRSVIERDDRLHHFSNLVSNM